MDICPFKHIFSSFVVYVNAAMKTGSQYRDNIKVFRDLVSRDTLSRFSFHLNSVTSHIIGIYLSFHIHKMGIQLCVSHSLFEVYMN